MSVLEIMWTEIHRVLKIVSREVIQVIADSADETGAVRVPQVMRVGAHAVRTLFKVHGRLPRYFANVVGVFDIQQHDRLAEVSQQRQLSVGRERRVVTGTYAVKMFDIELPFGPIETKYAGAANESIQVRAI